MIYVSRIFNFSAGPSTLPLPVLDKIESELANYNNSGMSVLELSHRSCEFEEIIKDCEMLLRDLMNIPSNYKVLFLQGGASSQFSMVPLNLLSTYKKALYVDTGTWSDKAISEAKKYGDIDIIASSKDKKYSYIPSFNLNDYDNDYDYLHITTNNTIEGTVYNHIPETNGYPIVADMSSDILSKNYDVSKFGVIYAGAQKNLGPAGLTVVIIREELIGRELDICPTMFSYKTHSKANSLYNTPPTFSIYVTKLVLEWIKNLGGISEIEKINTKKANDFYSFLDSSNLFSSPIKKEFRSLMNIPFTTNNEDMDKEFLDLANKHGFKNLEGHRSVGGLRASIYNAMPIEGVNNLIHLMSDFEHKKLGGKHV
ncbi:MAG: Phosphoserine aminotransferase [Bacillales bacterium]|jgi:phosphoserine aminotransferase|nr:Phosphoserine aminotransferase [Bacillales bacterium]